eukprot:1344976-Prymnesium_polylepis.1
MRGRACVTTTHWRMTHRSGRPSLSTWHVSSGCAQCCWTRQSRTIRTTLAWTCCPDDHAFQLGGGWGAKHT